MKNKQIINYNTEGEYHGYQQWYDGDNELWLRGNNKNGQPIGYEEVNWENAIGGEHTEVNFYIR